MVKRTKEQCATQHTALTFYGAREWLKKVEFCDMMQQPYFGPKKSLKWLEEKQPEAFDCYDKALLLRVWAAPTQALIKYGISPCLFRG